VPSFQSYTGETTKGDTGFLPKTGGGGGRIVKDRKFSACGKGKRGGKQVGPGEFAGTGRQ